VVALFAVVPPALARVCHVTPFPGVTAIKALAAFAAGAANARPPRRGQMVGAWHSLVELIVLAERAGTMDAAAAARWFRAACEAAAANDFAARSLDVLRWELINVDLTDADQESDALRRVSAALKEAVDRAEGRLVAARIVLRGSTPLHGSLHREEHRWRAELLGRIQDQGSEALWLESIKVLTTPVYDVALLAQRDALTKVVVEGLGQARTELTTLPDEILEMLDVLPPELRSEVEAEWNDTQRDGVLRDVQAIILEALGTKGGQTP